MADEQQPEPGMGFRLFKPGDVSIAEIREEARRLYGLEIHIRFQLGPTILKNTAKGQVIGCDMIAVDDKPLRGKYDAPIPAVGWCYYEGHFLPKEEVTE